MHSCPLIKRKYDEKEKKSLCMTREDILKIYPEANI